MLVARASLALFLATVVSCTSEPGTARVDAGRDAELMCSQVLFGIPGPSTGLNDSQCRPSCGCGAEEWIPPVWDEARISALATWTLLNPPPPLGSDPYELEVPAIDEAAVCAVSIVDRAARSYRLVDFPNSAAAEAAGAVVTHAGVCGLCSSLADLEVYARVLDLTAPVRACGVNHSDFAGDVACLQELGFSEPCAQIWAYNTAHTRSVCASTCVPLIAAPYHTPDGALNACLQCDEVNSGPVFKAIAGRTRRNTGIANALCRPCDQVVRLTHNYD